jgi:LysR family carnitine catabolism transcriptional activator
VDLRQLEYVVAVVDHGTFTQAAVVTHVTQPSLSQGIRSLEAELGVDLFHRVGRRAVVSAAGEAFVGPARQALRDARSAREAAAAVRGLTAGRLEIATLPTLAVDPLAAWVGAFREAYPGVDIVVSEPEDAASVHRLVGDGRCEIGLAELPAPPELEVVPLGSQRIVAIAPASADLPRSTRVPLTRLAALPVVSTPVGTSTRGVVDTAFARAGAVPRVAVETTSREALVPLVVAGAGITFLPFPVARAASGPIRLVEPDPPIHRSIGLVHRRGATSPAQAAFLALARRRPGPPSG